MRQKAWQRHAKRSLVSARRRRKSTRSFSSPKIAEPSTPREVTWYSPSGSWPRGVLGIRPKLVIDGSERTLRHAFGCTLAPNPLKGHVPSSHLEGQALLKTFGC